MKRMLLGVGAVTLVACGIACSMCQSPFDYSGPVVTPGGQPQHGFHDRENSVLSGSTAASTGGEFVEEGEGTVIESGQKPTPAKTRR